MAQTLALLEAALGDMAFGPEIEIICRGFALRVTTHSPDSGADDHMACPPACPFYEPPPAPVFCPACGYEDCDYEE